MAWITKVKRTRGDEWRVNWRDVAGSVPRRNHSSRAFSSLREAKQEKNRVEMEEERRSRPARAQQPTVRSWIQETIGLEGDEGRGWIVKPQLLSRSTLAVYRRHANRYVVPRLGGRKLGDLTRPIAQAFFDALTREGVHPPTMDAIHGLLSALSTAAIEADHLRDNPFLRVKFLRAAKPQHRYLDLPEIDAIAGQLPTAADRCLFLFFCYTGLRAGEAAALRVKDLDLARRRVTVHASLSEVEGRLIERETTKSGKDRRVRFPDELVVLLEEQIHGKTPAARVFTGTQGHDFRAGNWRNRVLRPACARAGIEPPYPTIHQLRHTAASLAIDSGMGLKALSEMLGHASIGITADLYGHLYDRHLDEASDQFSEYLKRQRNGRVADVEVLRPDA